MNKRNDDHPCEWLKVSRETSGLFIDPDVSMIGSMALLCRSRVRLLATCLQLLRVQGIKI